MFGYHPEKYHVAEFGVILIIATVTNFGNNLGIQFPESFLNNMQISENDDVETGLIFLLENQPR